jgi:hypothetical protein
MLRAGSDWHRLSDAGRWEPLSFEGEPPLWLSAPVAASGAWFMSIWDQTELSIWRSTDGNHWTRTLQLSPGGYGALYELNGLIVASGQHPAGDWFKATSNGFDWNIEVSEGPGFFKVLKTAAGYVGLTDTDGFRLVSFSADGVNWQVVESLPLVLDVAATPFGLIGSGDGDLYALTPDLSSATSLDLPFQPGAVVGVTSSGIVVTAGEYPYGYWYTEDLETWAELSVTLDGGFPGVDPQFIGGDRPLVGGWDRGAVRIWEFQR